MMTGAMERYRKRIPIAAILLAACSGSADGTCVDLHTVEACAGDDCTTVTCRGDELCFAGACEPWTEVPLQVDFDLTYDDDRPDRITCKVHADGFPRARVQALRFDFGDGSTGWSEWLDHDYEEPGIYPVELEVRLEGMRILRANRLAVIGADTAPPSHLFLTLNGIPDYLNGSIPFTSNAGSPYDSGDDYQRSFHLLLPQSGFSIDITLLETDTSPVDLRTLTVSANVPLANGRIAAGTNLAGRFKDPSSSAEWIRRRRWRVATGEAFPAGIVTLTLAAADTAGAALPTRELTFEVAELTPELDPFDRPMLWIFRFDLDFFQTTATEYDSGAIALDSTLGNNGEPDFREELGAIGAQGDESAAGAAEVAGRGKTGANAVYERWVIDAIIADTYRYYQITPDGTPLENIAFTILTQDDPRAPAPESFAASGDFSMMRFGGFFDGYFGYSRFAPFNEERVDDSDAAHGVATANILNPLVSMPVLTGELAGIKPTTGTAVGEHDLDGVVLADTFDRWDVDNSPAANLRYDDLARAARFIAMAVAAVTAHEMGHAMGLVPNGPPPDGFFGDCGDITFIGPNTNSHHVDLPGLNLMQAGGDILGVLLGALDNIYIPPGTTEVELAWILASENRLSPYARAYLNGALTHRGF